MEFRRGSLVVRIHATRAEAGRVAARDAAEELKALLQREGRASLLLSAAVSQLEFLAALREDQSVDWTRITGFHVDEYAGMTASHPASFRRFLQEHFVGRLPLAAFHGIDGQASDLAAECQRYGALLNDLRPGLAILGIGENGHLAFNDPPAARFDDPSDVKLVQLEEACRAQQVHDGAFVRIEDVPKLALTVTIPRLMRVPRVIVVAPGPAKREAVRLALEGPIDPACPASILRRHGRATLDLDLESAAGLSI
jgi:glucosamine-6-phosphate deaminase